MESETKRTETFYDARTGETVTRELTSEEMAALPGPDAPAEMPEPE